MNFEELSFRNLIHFYNDDLKRIKKGERASELLTERLRETLHKHGVLKRDGSLIRQGQGCRTVLTEEANRVLEEHRD